MEIRTFEIKLFITVSTEKAIEHMLEMKDEIMSGQIQREMMKDGADKVTATFTEVSKQRQNGNN